MLKTLAVIDQRYLNHFAGRAHPERPQRLTAIMEMLEQLHRPDLRQATAREASRAEIELCHTPDYVRQVERTAGLARYDFDPDTHTCSATHETALLAAGGVLSAVEAVMDGAAANGFALVRPPGHHALPERAMGFCFFNNVAIAASYLVKVRGLKRVLVVDWDVHHGNGTQDIFYPSREVMYVSLHQYPFYPGTGSLKETGVGEGRGYTVNVPFPADFGDDEYSAAFDEIILPIARQFNPEFVLVSAGFDGHFRDPLGQMEITEDGFRAMTRRLKRLAAECCEGRMVAALEGGYDLIACAASAKVVLEELGLDPDEHYGGPRKHRGADLLARVRAEMREFWQV